MITRGPPRRAATSEPWGASTMTRTGLAILLLAPLVALQGCGAGDPGQPAVGSISVGAKHDDGPKFAPKTGDGAARAK
jgi:hypothetical protein